MMMKEGGLVGLLLRDKFFWSRAREEDDWGAAQRSDFGEKEKKDEFARPVVRCRRIRRAKAGEVRMTRNR